MRPEEDKFVLATSERSLSSGSPIATNSVDLGSTSHPEGLTSGSGRRLMMSMPPKASSNQVSLAVRTCVLSNSTKSCSNGKQLETSGDTTPSNKNSKSFLTDDRRGRRLKAPNKEQILGMLKYAEFTGCSTPLRGRSTFDEKPVCTMETRKKEINVVDLETLPTFINIGLKPKGKYGIFQKVNSNESKSEVCRNLFGAPKTVTQFKLRPLPLAIARTTQNPSFNSESRMAALALDWNSVDENTKIETLEKLPTSPNKFFSFNITMEPQKKAHPTSPVLPKIAVNEDCRELARTPVGLKPNETSSDAPYIGSKMIRKQIDEDIKVEVPSMVVYDQKSEQLAESEFKQTVLLNPTTCFSTVHILLEENTEMPTLTKGTIVINENGLGNASSLLSKMPDLLFVGEKDMRKHMAANLSIEMFEDEIKTLAQLVKSPHKKKVKLDKLNKNESVFTDAAPFGSSLLRGFACDIPHVKFDLKTTSDKAVTLADFRGKVCQTGTTHKTISTVRKRTLGSLAPRKQAKKFRLVMKHVDLLTELHYHVMKSWNWASSSKFSTEPPKPFPTVNLDKNNVPTLLYTFDLDNVLYYMEGPDFSDSSDCDTAEY